MTTIFSRKRHSLLSSAVLSFLVLFTHNPVNAESEFDALEPILQPVTMPADTDLPVVSGALVPQIVGGQQATRGEHPWMVYVEVRRGGRVFSCGGSLISSEWVLSAAHCFDPGSSVTVIAGVFDQREERARNRFEVGSYFNHPSYRGVRTGFDIALLKLERPVPTSLVSRYARLPSLALNNSQAGTGDTLKVIGWGATQEGGSGPNILRQVSVPVVSEASCEASYGNVINNNTQICAGFPRGGRDSCQGDSGGPLLFKQNGADYVAGIVSWGQGCARPNLPGIYTRTSGFLNWIDSIAGGSSSNPPAQGGGGGTVNNLAASASTWTQTYRLNIPAGTSTFDVDISGPNGDADLYVYYNQTPTTPVNAVVNSTTRCVPWVSGSNESCSFRNPRAGEWFVRVRGYETFSGLTLEARYEP
ncbi:trypsin-like serine protease [Marinagarivorans algicola]|uniref:trypsin-like serine protease n=1 Tax=Marinagarivorans algicola TaxID=1513270 RepID=UPI003736B6CA